MCSLTPQTEVVTCSAADLFETACEIQFADNSDEETIKAELSQYYSEEELTREVMMREAVNFLKSSGSFMVVSANYEIEQFKIIQA